MRYWPRVWGENSHRDCPEHNTVSRDPGQERLTGLALVLEVVHSLPHYEGLRLGEPVLLAEEAVPLEVVVGGRAAGEPGGRSYRPSIRSSGIIMRWRFIFQAPFKHQIMVLTFQIETTKPTTCPRTSHLLSLRQRSSHSVLLMSLCSALTKPRSS